MSSSFTVLAGQKPTTPLALSQRPSMRRLSMRWPSAYTRTASVPTISSFRMAGNGPARSQVWKNGPQSMYLASSVRSKFLNTRRPMNLGTVGTKFAKSTGVLLARALASGHIGTCFLLACCVRTFS
ncbi:hypothetical protein FQZ97_866290 [compost metagenome]